MAFDITNSLTADRWAHPLNAIETFATRVDARLHAVAAQVEAGREAPLSWLAKLQDMLAATEGRLDAIAARASTNHDAQIEQIRATLDAAAAKIGALAAPVSAKVVGPTPPEREPEEPAVEEPDQPQAEAPAVEEPSRWERPVENLERFVERIDSRIERIAERIEDGGAAPEDWLRSIQEKLEALDARLDHLAKYAPDALDLRIEAVRDAADAALARLDAILEGASAPEIDGPATEEPDVESPEAEAPEVEAPAVETPEREPSRWERPVENLERFVERIDSRIERIAERIEDGGAAPEDWLRSIQEKLEAFDARLDHLAKYAPDALDLRIEAVRDAADAALARLEAILEDPPAPKPEPEPQPQPDVQASDFTGDGEVVVIIDTGWNQEYLGEEEQPVTEYDFYSKDGSAKVGASNDHGSWVDQVVRSVAVDVETIHLKVTPDNGAYAPYSAIENALDWVIKHVDSYNIVAVNISLGSGNTTSEMTSSLSDTFAALDNLGVFSILAAGNSGEAGVQELAADPNAIAVSAATEDGDVAEFSQHDPILTDVFAFGDSVSIEDEGGATTSVSGSSFAAPYVAGAAARLQDAADALIGRDLTDDEFVEILQASGDDVNGYESEDAPEGYAIANADAAVQYFIDNHADYMAIA